jgi:hypothetical protein
MRDLCRVSGAAAVRVLFGAILVLLVPFGAAVPLDPAPTIQLIDRDPGRNVDLRAGEPLYLRLRYQSPIPIHILLSGYDRGDMVRGYLQDSDELFPAGDRAVTAWLAYPRDARIDQVEVRIWNANQARVAATRIPIEAQWTDADGAGAERETKSWVTELTPGQRERMAARLSAADETSGFDPFDLIFLCVPGYFLLQLALALRTSGGWRKAALVPTVIMVPVLAYTVLAFAAQSNLWPLLLLLSAPLACVYLILLSMLLLLRRLTRPA